MTHGWRHTSHHSNSYRCMQRENYDIGEEAVERFSLPAEDKASLELSEWVAGAYKRALVCLQMPFY